MKLVKCNGRLYGLAAALVLGVISTPTYAGSINYSFESPTRGAGSDAYFAVFELSGKHVSQWDRHYGSNEHHAQEQDLRAVFGLEQAVVKIWILGEGTHGIFSTLGSGNLHLRAVGSDCLPTPVPLPGAAWLLFSGLLGLGGFHSRQSSSQG